MSAEYWEIREIALDELNREKGWMSYKEARALVQSVKDSSSLDPTERETYNTAHWVLDFHRPYVKKCGNPYMLLRQKRRQRRNSLIVMGLFLVVALNVGMGCLRIYSKGVKLTISQGILAVKPDRPEMNFRAKLLKLIEIN